MIRIVQEFFRRTKHVIIQNDDSRFHLLERKINGICMSSQREDEEIVYFFHKRTTRAACFSQLSLDAMEV